MNQVVSRGFVPTDEKDFNTDNLIILLKAQSDILYLLDRGYPIKSASTFVGNHFLLSERQRLALLRATSTTEIIKKRKAKKVCSSNVTNQTINIDGLNLIITLEVALSGTTLIGCMDGTIRDLAGLRGTYRLIDKTDEAIRLIGKKLDEMQIKEVVFYLDSPVSNTGRLKQRILDLLSEYSYTVKVDLVPNADIVLVQKEYVISSDSIILNECISWINLAYEIIKAEKIDSLKDFSRGSTDI
jgi:hypothetical protein